MLNLDPLLRDRDPGQAPVELARADSRLSDISEQVIRGEYLQAAQKVEELWQEQIFDARLIGYHLYGVFLERGITSLPDILRAAHKILTDNREMFTPVRKRELFLDGSMHWLLSTLARQFERSEQLGDDHWKSWVEPANLTFLQAAQVPHEALSQPLSTLVPRPRAMAPYLHIGEILSRFVSTHASTAAPAESARTGAPAALERPLSSAKTLAAQQSQSGTRGESEGEGKPQDAADARQSPKPADSQDEADEAAEGPPRRPRARYARAVSSPGVPDDESPEDDEAREDAEAARGIDPDAHASRDSDGDGDDPDSAGARHDDDEDGPDKKDPPRDGDVARATAPRRQLLRRSESARPPAPASGKAAEAGIMVRGSAALALLARKMQLFEELVDAGEHLKAAVIAADLQRTLDHFDPRVFLPSLFVPYLTKLVLSAAELEDPLSQTESLIFRSLAQLYAADLDAFMRAGRQD